MTLRSGCVCGVLSRFPLPKWQLSGCVACPPLGSATNSSSSSSSSNASNSCNRHTRKVPPAARHGLAQPWRQSRADAGYHCRGIRRGRAEPQSRSHGHARIVLDTPRNVSEGEHASPRIYGVRNVAGSCCLNCSDACECAVTHVLVVCASPLLSVCHCLDRRCPSVTIRGASLTQSSSQKSSTMHGCRWMRSVGGVRSVVGEGAVQLAAGRTRSHSKPGVRANACAPSVPRSSLV
jgi:hypothetical protein